MRRIFVGKAAATGGGGVDRLGSLPDEILRHALSFLPSRDAVRTCVLARRWRHLWKSAAALRVTNVDAFRCARHVNNFVNHLIVLRDRTPLRECEIAVYKEEDDDGEGYYDSDGERLEHSQYIDLWVRYALSCNARLLRISDHDPNDLEAGHEACIRNVLLAIPIFSQHLTTLEFDGVVLSCECSYSLDFSSCPNLETLKMNRCSFQFLGRDGPTNLSSQSVRCLSIIGCDFRSFDQARALISVPSVVYLELAVNYGLVPVFESMMPSLLTTSIKLDGTSNKDDKGGSLLLGRLSDSTNLELIAKSQAFAFMKALKRCTTFSKLKTLSLNNWCVEPDFGPLLYFLRRSPNLESLNIRLSKPYQHVEETDGCYNSLEPFLASKHFVVAEIECRTKDERVDKILKVLSSCGVPGEQINVKTINWSSDGSYTDSDYSYSDTEQSD